MQFLSRHGSNKVGRSAVGLLTALLVIVIVIVIAGPATAAPHPSTPAEVRSVFPAATTSVEQAAANWAGSQTGSTSYEYLCLTFVYQAYISAGFSRASLNAAAGWSPNSNSYPIDEWNYWAAGHTPSGVVHTGYDSSPPVGAIIYYSNRLGHDYSHATISLGGGQQISPDTTGVSGPQSVNTNSYRTMLGWWLPEGTTTNGGSDDPKSAYDFIESPTAGTIHVRGWAYDPNASSASVEIDAYVGASAGQPGSEGHNLGGTNAYRPDVAQAFGVGDHQGFDVAFTTGLTGSQPVYLYAINLAGTPGNTTYIGRMDVTVANPNPVAQYDFIESATAGTVHVRGWAYDPNASSASVEIDAYVGASAGQPGSEGHNLGGTNAYRPDVAQAFGVGDHQGFDVTFTTGLTGSQPVYLYAINLAGTPGNTTYIGRMDVTVEAPPPLVATTTTLTTTTPTVTVGERAAITAAIVDADHSKPTGTVTFIVDGTPGPAVGVSSAGKANLQLSTLHAGNHQIVASYNGTTSTAASTSSEATESVVQAGTTTTLTESGKAQAPKVIATVVAKAPGGGRPQGSVTFSIDGVTTTANLINGKATIRPGVGIHTITAAYPGNNDYSPSASQ